MIDVYQIALIKKEHELSTFKELSDFDQIVLWTSCWYIYIQVRVYGHV